jgi:hypothetical protein
MSDGQFDFDDYQFPDEYFEDLEEYEENGPEYSIVQGAIYDFMRNDVRFSAVDAADVSRYLNRGEVDEAEGFIEERLEEEP